MLDNITTEVSKLNIEWFKDKKAQFEKEGLFNKATGEIDETIPIGDGERTYNIALSEYCWHSYFPDTNYHREDNPSILDAEEIVNNIISLIKEEIEEYSENTPKHYLIERSKVTIRNALFIDNSAEQFTEAKAFIYSKFAKLCYTYFGKIRREYQMNLPDNNKLIFGISKNQTAALLHLLKENKIILTDYYTLMDFCNNYFYYQTNEAQPSQSVADISKAFKACNNSANRGINMLKNRLRKIVK